MAPTIIYQNEQPVMVLGAPGSTQIITSLVQVILNVIDFGMDIGNAVMAARFDCQGELIRCHMRIPEYTCDKVRARHPITRIPYSHGTFGRVCAITIDPTTGARRGAADTGTAGMALEVAV
jgi:gamma-glutamyltranspeptidase/glutathione hydrolase